ncbi:MAG: 1-acyl-sn-glycerol-3-phosphate acyltransferase [Actinobacteria bacterium]|nr:1-acyl-sn-glycerol-3-phosphate acyltransferase [Actinomycetota bacterium]
MAIGPGRLLLRLWNRMTLAGEDLLPDGPVVVAANHFSHLDPVVVGLAVRRPTRFLAVDELYGNSRFFDGLTSWLGAIPMSRTRAPLGALRLALAELAAGGSVGLYPEGVRVWRWGEQQPKRGAAWLARRAGVPLVPVAVCGTDEAMGRGTARIGRSPIHVQVCEPIMPGAFADCPDPLGEMTALWAERVGSVLQSWYGA